MTRQGERSGGGDRQESAAWNHEGFPCNGLFPVSGFLPGNDPCPDRCGSQGKIDPLLGLKENVIIGKLIPAGTGMAKYRNVTAVPNVEENREVLA